MKSYGYLFGVLKLWKDTHHDEVFVEANNHIIIRNGCYIVDYKDLVAMARSLGVKPWRFTVIDYKELDSDG